MEVRLGGRITQDHGGGVFGRRRRPDYAVERHVLIRGKRRISGPKDLRYCDSMEQRITDAAPTSSVIPLIDFFAKTKAPQEAPTRAVSEPMAGVPKLFRPYQAAQS